MIRVESRAVLGQGVRLYRLGEGRRARCRRVRRFQTFPSRCHDLHKRCRATFHSGPES